MLSQYPGGACTGTDKVSAVSVSGALTCTEDTGGSETNSLETLTTGIATTEIPIGTAPDTVVYAALSGQATMTNGGVVTVTDVTCTNCLTNTEVASADLATNVSDADLGDVTVASGAWAVEDDSHAHTGATLTGSAEAYDASGWDADTSVPTKNDVRDKIETLGEGSGLSHAQVMSRTFLGG